VKNENRFLELVNTGVKGSSPDFQHYHEAHVPLSLTYPTLVGLHGMMKMILLNLVHSW
jgi:hypothetical protein